MAGQPRIGRRRAVSLIAGSALGLAACSLPTPAGRQSPPSQRVSSTGVLVVAVPATAQGKPAAPWPAIVAQAQAPGGPELRAIPLPYAPSTPSPSGTPTYDLGLGLSAALAGGQRQRPDLIAVNGITMAPLADAGLLLPLDAAMAEDRAFRRADYLPGALDLGAWHGHQLALPIGAIPTALGYDPAAFQQAGLVPSEGSWSRAELATVAAKLTTPAGGKDGARWGFRPTLWTCWQFLLADGIDPGAPAGQPNGLGSPAVTASLAALAGLWLTKQVAPPPGNATAGGAMTITLAQIGLGGGLNAYLKWRFAEPPRGKEQATRVDALAAVAMTPAAAGRDAVFAAMQRLQAAADAFALLPARLQRSAVPLARSPQATPTAFRAPDSDELHAFRNMAAYGRGIRADISLAVTGTLIAFLNGKLTPEQATAQMGKAAQKVHDASD